MPRALTAAILGALLSSALGCEAPSDPGKHRATARSQDEVHREPLEPLPAPPAEDPRLVSLGKRLFADVRLSRDESVSCSSCHDLAHGGADTKRFSMGVSGRIGTTNTPTVYNSALNFVQFWDGRTTTLEHQIDEAIESPTDFDTSWKNVSPKLAQDAELRSNFNSVFQGGATSENVKRAIAAYERTLVTVDSPFDRWLDGDATAMSAEEKAGYDNFKTVGCVACHQGRNVGGNMFQRFGVFGDYFAERGDVTTADYGRFNVTHDEADRFVFRVPSLRCAARTAPYFHDGSAPTLARAVQVMAEYQLGRTLTVAQDSSIVAFLGALGPCGPGDGSE